MGQRTPNQEDRAFLDYLADSPAGHAFGSELDRFRTEVGERAKRRCSRYGWAAYCRIGPSWEITPAGRAALQKEEEGRG